jgi:protein-S-isoprenylcysteine O-methyltransferase Ste14
MKWFRVAADAPTSQHVAATLAQTAVFWTTFLYLLPELVAAAENQLSLPSLHQFVPHGQVIGATLFVAASALGLWTGILMAVRGRGTPLPLAAARELVCVGPYRVIRNPMALAGILQGVAVGLWRESVAVVLYALAGALLWHVTARVAEETFLTERFATSFRAYRERVPLWLPRLLPRRGERWLGAAIAAAGTARFAWLATPGERLVTGLGPNDAAAVTFGDLYRALPLTFAAVLVGALLWARSRAAAITASPRTS